MSKIFEQVIVPAAHGGKIEVKKGQYLKVTDIDGGQIADLFAFMKSDTREYLSMAHTRFEIGSYYIVEGQTLVSNNHRPLLKLVKDTCGIHDMTYAACNPGYYTEKHNMSTSEGKRSCRRNALEVLEPYAIEEWRIKDPLDLFQFSPGMSIQTSKDSPGTYVIFEVLEDLIVAVSSCPYYEEMGIKKSTPIELVSIDEL